MTVKQPDAVRKHDGRVVAFDRAVLAASVTRAALSAGDHDTLEAAEAFGHEVSLAVAEFLAREGPATPSTADIRQMTQKLLRGMPFPGTAETYTDYARNASSLLWSMRLVDGPGGEGVPWDRRRLLESLRAAGVARDPAGEVAREVERRLVALGETRISAALVHALAELALSARSIDTRLYAARRVAATFAVHVPRYDAVAARANPLPAGGPALRAFWLQAVHTPEISAAARDSAFALEPFPADPQDWRGGPPAFDAACDPLRAETAQRLRDWSAGTAGEPWLCADEKTRIGAVAKLLAEWNEDERKETVPAGALWLMLRRRPSISPAKPGTSALPVTLNVGGLLVREAVRDPQRATVRLAQLAGLAAQAHREREEYFGLPVVRGRELPIAAAGLWNAAAWLCGKPYDKTEPHEDLRAVAGALVGALHSAITTLRSETGMQVTLVSEAPHAACAALWAADREHFARDGLNLDPAGAYSGGAALYADAGTEDLGTRVDFLAGVAPLFDEPSALELRAPLGREPDQNFWRELLAVLAGSRLPRVKLLPGGSARGCKAFTRLLRRHLEGFPLFEQAD